MNVNVNLDPLGHRYTTHHKCISTSQSSPTPYALSSLHRLPESYRPGTSAPTHCYKPYSHSGCRCRDEIAYVGEDCESYQDLPFFHGVNDSCARPSRCRRLAAGFAAAAYRTPASAITPVDVGGSAVTFFERGVSAASRLKDGTKCSCFAVDPYQRFAFVSNERTGTQVEIWTSASSTPAAVLAFRGTEVDDPRDLATDIFFSQRQLDGAAVGMPSMLPDETSLVHSGFGRAYGSTRDAVHHVLAQLGVLGDGDGDSNGDGDDSGPALLLTGHSLGGALALLAARELGVPLGPRLSVYTFGAPRVGNTALAAEVLRGTARSDGPWRVVNYDDYLVPRYPRGTPANRLFDYVHVGATVLLPPTDAASPLCIRVARTGDARGCPLKEINPRYRGIVPPTLFEWPQTNLPRFVLAEARAVWRLLTRGGVAEHYMTAYDAQLCRCLASFSSGDLALVEEGLHVVQQQQEQVDAAARHEGRSSQHSAVEEHGPDGTPPGGRTPEPREYLDLLRATWGD